jgi:endonuclease YncB( thermonuclease family)
LALLVWPAKLYYLCMKISELLRIRGLEKRLPLIVLIIVLIMWSQLSPRVYSGVSNWFHQNQPGLYAVTKVYDGDTIEVSRNGESFTIRMIGIDTPETHHPEKPVQCFGEEATKFAKSLLDGREVRLEADAVGDNIDRYGRQLRYVYRDDELHVNKILVVRGYAFSYRGFLHSKLIEFEEAESFAREHQKGLWGGCKTSQNQHGGFETNGITQ